MPGATEELIIGMSLIGRLDVVFKRNGEVYATGDQP